MRLHVVSRETIVPFSPTPPPLRNYKLCWLDQLTPISHLPLILYYTSVPESPSPLANLKTSLSYTLSCFYPLAGRLDGNSLVICDDEGIDFFEARANVSLSDLLRQPQLEQLTKLLPCAHCCCQTDADTLLAIQVTIFARHGMSIGLCVSHKIADGRSLLTFLESWAAAAHGAHGEGWSPTFDGASVLPPNETVVPVGGGWTAAEKPVKRTRFVFDESNLAKLRASSEPVPTRNQAVSALLWHSAARARAKVSSGPNKWSVVMQLYDLRSRMSPPLPESSFGNRCIVALAAASPETTQSKAKHILEEELRSSVRRIHGHKVRQLQKEDGFTCWNEAMMETAVRCGEVGFDMYFFSSWLRLPLYELDFGWGKPLWAGQGGEADANTVVLMPRGVDGGVEAWVALEEEVMEEFKRDEELLSFASADPPLLLI